MLQRRGSLAVTIPMLETVEVAAIEQQIHHASADRLLLQRHTQYPLYGELPSQRLGSGYDFADNRLFQAGDERRFINWRQFARSGELHLKQFHEELQPALLILLDKRRPMVFGSRRRLKVQQAVVVALAALFQARQLGYDVGALVLDEAMEWLAPQSAATNLDRLIELFNRPLSATPPPGPPLQHALALLQQRAVAGTQVFFISDGHDVGEAEEALLWQLHQDHPLQVFHLHDALEQSLPEAGKLHFERDGGVVTIDTGSSVQREHYRQRMGQQLQTLGRRLQGAAQHYYSVATDSDPLREVFGVDNG